MESAFDNNQLSPKPQADSRLVDLRVWMLRNGVTFPKIGKALGGITGAAVQQMLKSKRISFARHKDLTDFGVPSHLLPPADDVRRGRPAVSK
jgi:hypothetical protein